MLIYHKTNNKIRCVQVILGDGTSNINHVDYVWKQHQKMVNTLENNGDVLVTGGTFVGAVYEGSYHKRDSFKHYLEDI